MPKPNITHTILGQYAERCEILTMQLAQAQETIRAQAETIKEYESCQKVEESPVDSD